MSYEKLIVDFEVIDFVNRYHRYFDINEETLPLELIDEVAQDGVYLTEDHTFEYCRVEPLTPEISVRGTVMDAGHALENNIQAKIDRMLSEYVQPELDENVIAKMHEILAARGVDAKLIKKLENM